MANKRGIHLLLIILVNWCCFQLALPTWNEEQKRQKKRIGNTNTFVRSLWLWETVASCFDSDTKRNVFNDILSARKWFHTAWTNDNRLWNGEWLQLSNWTWNVDCFEGRKNILTFSVIHRRCLVQKTRVELDFLQNTACFSGLKYQKILLSTIQNTECKHRLYTRHWTTK